MISSNNITNNSANRSGGGIRLYDSDNLLINNLIAYNTAGQTGGGISCHNCDDLTIINNTITGNYSTGSGGGIRCSGSLPIVKNSIIWGNTSDQVSGHPIVTYSNVQGGYNGEGNIDDDPLFVDPDNDDYHLKAIYCGDSINSPCIDSGDPDYKDIFRDCDWGLGYYRSDMGAYGGGTFHEPEIIISMIPNNPPIYVPAGGMFDYTGIIANTTNEQQSVDIWIMLRLPSGDIFGPIQRIDNLILAPFQIVSVDNVTQHVPVLAPMGTYNYIAYCGEHQISKIDSISFEFTVTSPAGDIADSWNLFGWFGGIEDQSPEIPTTFALSPNYPNPFNANTTINFQLPFDSNIRLQIYNLLGQNVETLVDSQIKAGYHSIQWNASHYSSGIYFYKLTAGDKVITKRMTLLK